MHVYHIILFHRNDWSCKSSLTVSKSVQSVFFSVRDTELKIWQNISVYYKILSLRKQISMEKGEMELAFQSI